MTQVLEVTHDAGFFSCSTIRLRSIINFYNQNNLLPIVDSSRQWSSYKDIEGDITPILFKENDIISNIKDTIIFSDDDREDQFSDYAKLNYDDIKFFIDRYFKPSEKILETKKKFIEKYNIDVANTISIYFRGNNKGRETYLPSHQQMINKINEVKTKFPNHKILLQTDEVEFCESVLSHYPNTIIIKELKQINNCDNDVHSLTPIGERIDLAINLLSSILILSETSQVILNSGNVGMWICLFRKNSNGVYQFLSNSFL